MISQSKSTQNFSRLKGRPIPYDYGAGDESATRFFYAFDDAYGIVFVFLKKRDRDSFVDQIINKITVFVDHIDNHKSFAVFVGPYLFDSKTQDLKRPLCIPPYNRYLNNYRNVISTLDSKGFTSQQIMAILKPRG